MYMIRRNVWNVTARYSFVSLMVHQKDWHCFLPLKLLPHVLALRIGRPSSALSCALEHVVERYRGDSFSYYKTTSRFDKFRKHKKSIGFITIRLNYTSTPLPTKYAN